MDNRNLSVHYDTGGCFVEPSNLTTQPTTQIELKISEPDARLRLGDLTATVVCRSELPIEITVVKNDCHCTQSYCCLGINIFALGPPECKNCPLRVTEVKRSCEVPRPAQIGVDLKFRSSFLSGYGPASDADFLPSTSGVRWAGSPYGVLKLSCSVTPDATETTPSSNDLAALRDGCKNECVAELTETEATQIARVNNKQFVKISSKQRMEFHGIDESTVSFRARPGTIMTLAAKWVALDGGVP